MKKLVFTTISRGLPVVALILLMPILAHTSVTTQAGPYHVEVAAGSNPIALGKSKLLIRLTDSAGKPVDNATIRSLTKMSGMSMGEREVRAMPQPGQPGVYAAPAQFAMEGAYGATLQIDGAQGSASTTVPLNTGQDTGALSSGTTQGQTPASGPVSTPNGTTRPLWLWLAGATLVAFVLYRVWRTGQRPDLKAVANRSVVGGLLLIGVMLALSTYAVNRFRRPGSMTPIEAQGMEMELPAPAGSAPVELATVRRGSIANRVRYTGQAVGFVEQDVTPRITGTITEMTVYAGDRVRRGQVLARLDTSQAAPLVANQRAGLDMAAQGVGVARKEYQQTLAAINEAHAEVGMKIGGVESARADLRAAQDECAGQQAQLEAAQSMTLDAAAQVQSAQADQTYWRDEISREASLLKAGAVTQEEYQRERAQAENADAKVRQAQARVVQTQAQIRAAQSLVRKAEAMIASATSKVAQAQSELDSHYAHVRSTEAAADSSRQKIAQAQAGMTQARATLAGASATQGYSEIRAQTDGVVTERLISPGTLVNPGQTILRVAQISPIRLQANVTEGDLALVRVGSGVRVSKQGETGAALTAVVTSVAPSIDAQARTGVVEAVVPNKDARFLPGQYVTLDVSTGSTADALLIPTRALRYHTPPSGGAVSTQSVPFVWVAESDAGQNVPGQSASGQDAQYTAREVQVTVGLSDGQNTEVRSGLKAGQKVITAGQDYLKDGDVVAPATPMAAADAVFMPVASMPTNSVPAASRPASSSAPAMPTGNGGAMPTDSSGAMAAMPGMSGSHSSARGGRK